VNTGELRRQILRALDSARKDAGDRRRTVDDAAAAYQRFLADVAVPLVKQAVDVLRAEGHAFAAHTPADSVRLASESAPQVFLEFGLDAAGSTPHIIGRVSFVRARAQSVVEERPIAPGKAVDATGEEDVARFLVEEIPKLVMKHS
jgi:hypothetical protein